MDQDKDLKDGFNSGYIIEKFKPELAKELVESLEKIDTPFSEGFKEGSKESIKDREKSRSKVISKLRGFGKGRISEPKMDRNPDKDKGFDIER